MICPFLAYLDMQAMAELSLGVTPCARGAAGRGGAQPAHLQRPPRPCRRHTHRELVRAGLGPLPAGCGI
jgi:hypothetical protein